MPPGVRWKKGVEIPGDIAEKIRQGHHVFVPRPEDQPAEGLHPGDRDQPPVGQVDARRQMPVVGGGDQPSVARIAPAVIGADEAARAARILAAQPGAAMPATVEQHPDLAIGIAHHHHLRAAQRAHDVIAGGGDLAVMGEEHPGAVEDALDFEPVDVLADEGIARNEPPCGIDPAPAGPVEWVAVHGAAPPPRSGSILRACAGAHSADPAAIRG